MLSRFMAALLTDGFSVTIIPNKESERQEKMPSRMRNSLWKTAAFQAEYSPKTASLVELYQLFRAPGTDRPGLLNIQPLHEPGELLPGQRLYFPGIPRPLVTAIVQPLVRTETGCWNRDLSQSSAAQKGPGCSIPCAYRCSHRQYICSLPVGYLPAS